MPQIDTYSAGTVTVTSGSNTITGSGTAWVSGSYYAIVAGHFIRVGNYIGLITAVNSATSITVVPAYPTSTLSGQTYQVYRTTRIDTPEVLGFLQSLKAQIDGSSPILRTTIDSGAVRAAWRDDGSGNFSGYVGNTGAADGSMIEFMEVNKTTGAVRFPGVGTFASTAKVVAGLTVGNDAGYLYDATSGDIAIRSGLVGSEKYFIFKANGVFQALTGGATFGGNVGIGTTAPATKLHVAVPDGELSILSSGASKAIRFLHNSTTSVIAGVDQTGFASLQPITITGSTVQLDTSAGPTLTATASGNVGIGTATPEGKLAVALAGGRTYGTAWDNKVALFGGTAAFSAAFGISFDATNGGLLETAEPGVASLPLRFGGSRFEFLTGNVGIGTASPGSKLSVVGTVTAFVPSSQSALDIYNTGVNKIWALAPVTNGSDTDLALFTNSGTPGTRLVLNGASGHVAPGADNTQTLGTASSRWSVVYAGTGTINTSDENDKTRLRTFTPEEIAAAKELAGSIGVYQWKDAVDQKGEDGARLHVGLIAQQVQAVMEKHGLDPWRYGFMCKDAITRKAKKTETRKVQKTEVVTETYTEVEIIDGVPTQVEKTREVKRPAVEMVQVVGKDGKPVFTEREETVPVEPAKPSKKKGKKSDDESVEPTAPAETITRTVREPVLHPVPVMVEEEVEVEFDEDAGERLGLRYDQVYGFILAGMAA